MMLTMLQPLPSTLLFYIAGHTYISLAWKGDGDGDILSLEEKNQTIDDKSK